MVRDGLVWAALATCMLAIVPAAFSDGTDEADVAADVPSNPQLSVAVRGGDAQFEAFTDVLAPVYATDSGLFFVNPRYSRNDASEGELNLGLGYRHLFGKKNMILGGNAYYDYRRTEFGSDFHQLGLGVEFLSTWVDARANYYLPEGKVETVNEHTEREVEQLIESITRWDLPYAEHDSIIQHAMTMERITTTTTTHFYEQYEEALEGFDAEIGLLLPIPMIRDYANVRLFGGYYSFNGRTGDDIAGFKGRLEVQAMPWLFVDAEMFEDAELYGSDYFIGARVRLPFDCGKLADGGNPFAGAFGGPGEDTPFATRLGDMVMRDLHVRTGVSERKEVDERVDVIINETFGSLFTVLGTDIMFVHGDIGDDANPGTAELPKKTFNGALNDVSVPYNIFVFDAASGYYTNVTIDRSVRIMGQGHPIGFAGLTVNGGQHPVVNSGGSGTPTFVIDGDLGAQTVALYGFDIRNSGSIGLACVGIVNVDTVELAYNIFDTAYVGLIGIYDTPGTYNLSAHHNTFRNVGIGSAVDGSNGATMNVSLRNNTIYSTPVGAIGLTIDGGATLNYAFRDNTVSGGGFGSEVGEEAIQFLADLLSLGVTVPDLPDTFPSLGGVVVGAIGNSTVNADLQHNSISDNLLGIAGFGYGPGSTLNMVVKGNTISGGGTAAILKWLSDEAILSVPAELQQLDTALAGVAVLGIEQATVDASVTENTVSKQVLGLGALDLFDADVTVNVDSNVFADNLIAVAGVGIDGSDLNFAVRENTLTDNAIGIIAAGYGSDTRMNGLEITGNTINGGMPWDVLDGLAGTTPDGILGIGVIGIDGAEIDNAAIKDNTVNNHIIGGAVAGLGAGSMNGHVITGNTFDDSLLGLGVIGLYTPMNGYNISGNTFNGGGMDSLGALIDGIMGGGPTAWPDAGVAGLAVVGIGSGATMNNYRIEGNTVNDNLLSIGVVGADSAVIDGTVISNNTINSTVLGAGLAAFGSVSMQDSRIVDNVIDGAMVGVAVGGYQSDLNNTRVARNTITGSANAAQVGFLTDIVGLLGVTSDLEDILGGISFPAELPTTGGLAGVLVYGEECSGPTTVAVTGNTIRDNLLTVLVNSDTNVPPLNVTVTGNDNEIASPTVFLGDTFTYTVSGNTENTVLVNP